MNTELLREDEREMPSVRHTSWSDWQAYIQLLRQRLIEEREVSAHYLEMLTDARLQIAKLQAELAEEQRWSSITSKEVKELVEAQKTMKTGAR